MSSPLLLIFDGYLSQDADRVGQALEAMTSDDCNFRDKMSAAPAELLSLATDPQLHAILDTYLCESPQVAAIPSSHDGSLPLHFAASFGNIAIAKLIWTYHPQAASLPNVKGKIPLHYAAREGRTDMVYWFLDVAPHTATLASSKNKLALHFASGDGHVEIVQALLRVYPAGARLASAKGKLALHFAARWGHLAIARELIQVYPAAVRALDWEGSLPLHDCAREGQYEMARFLVEQYPWGLVTANIKSEIPLFPAVRSANLDLLCYMVQTFPAGAKHVLKAAGAEDREWRLPDITELLLRGAVGNFVDYALLRGRVVPTIHFLNEAAIIDSAERGATFETSDRESKLRPLLAPGYSLMEAAAIQPAPPAAVAPRLDDTAPSAAGDGDSKKRKSSTLDPSGRKRSRQKWRLVVNQPRPFLPLHAALESGASYHVVQHVLDTFGGAQRQDERGRWPLHVALTRCTSEQDTRLFDLVKDHLISRDASAARETESSRLPLHIGLDARAHVSIIECLLEVYPQAGVEVCQTNDRWVDDLPISRALNCDLCVVFRLLRIDPVVVSMLVAMHDDEGEPALLES